MWRGGRGVVFCGVGTATLATLVLSACVGDLPSGSPPEAGTDGAALDAPGVDALPDSTSDAGNVGADVADAGGMGDAPDARAASDGGDASGVSDAPDAATVPDGSHDAGVALLVQTGTLCGGAGTCTLTLPAASKAGNLLLIVFAVGGSAAPQLPSPWMQAVFVQSAENVGIWYYPNNPGGVVDVAVTTGTAESVRGQLTEWSGISTYDRTNDVTVASATSATIATALPTTAAVAVTAFGEKLAAASQVTLTAGTGGWMPLGDDSTSSTNYHLATDYLLAPPVGTVVSETEQCTASGDWVGVIATFY